MCVTLEPKHLEFNVCFLCCMSSMLHPVQISAWLLVGEAEFQYQSERHEGRHVSNLAKQIAWVLVVTGLESTTLRGAAQCMSQCKEEIFLAVLQWFSFHGGLQRGHNELESQDDILSDQIDGLRYGVVTIQICWKFGAAATSSAGTIPRDAVPSSMAERGESEEPALFPEIPLAPPLANLSQVHVTFRNELNACLSREGLKTSPEFQRCIMLILDNMNGAQPMPRGTKINLFQLLGGRLERLADQQRQRSESLMAERYQAYANQLRNMAWID
eukprot:s3830_g7.t1